MQILGAVIAANTLVLGVLVKLLLSYWRDQREVWRTLSNVDKKLTRVETRLSDHLEAHKQWAQQ